MSIFNQYKEPVFLNTSTSLQDQIHQLKELESKLNDDGKERVKKDIKLLEYGVFGENSIIYELQNSHMPLYILHDVYFEIDGFTAQIDFLVFTPKLCFVIECKNLYGNITVNNDGSFIRKVYFGSRYISEGIYSPLTQNERHLQVIKKIRLNQAGTIKKLLINNSFDITYKPIVVIANSKTILNTRYAPKNIKSKIIRADQLIEYMKSEYHASKISPASDKATRQWAESFLACSKVNTADYLKKYNEYIIEVPKQLDKSILYEQLKTFRYETAKAENIAAYIVFNNKTLDALIEKYPTTLEELKETPGFKDVKVQKYGKAILDIFLGNTNK
ncbi:HRDC domain-containing protein [Beduini massiliensis]|uniref:HRDC domain-containing protein n=1 Tax=Beduini massiliensis TaxID=1585974 RepID=UPI00059AA680|nr:HRDC domain-containing protein [Beduini massiliensis]